MTQRANEPIGKYAVHLNLAAGKVRLQSREALGSNEEERGRLLINHLLRSMNPKLRGQVAHIVDGKAVHERPEYWHLVKFAVEKEAEINFNEAKEGLKAKGYDTLLIQLTEIQPPSEPNCMDGSSST